MAKPHEDPKLFGAAQIAGQAGAELGEMMINAMADKAAMMATVALDLKEGLTMTADLDAQISQYVNTIMATMLINCSSAVFAAAIAGDMRLHVEACRDHDKITEEDARKAIVKSIDVMLMGLTQASIMNAVDIVNTELTGAGKPAFFGPQAEQNMRDVADKANAAVAEMLARAKKG